MHLQRAVLEQAGTRILAKIQNFWKPGEAVLPCIRLCLDGVINQYTAVAYPGFAFRHVYAACVEVFRFGIVLMPPQGYADILQHELFARELNPMPQVALVYDYLVLDSRPSTRSDTGKWTGTSNRQRCACGHINQTAIRRLFG